MGKIKQGSSLDISGFGAVIKQLSKISGKDFETTLKAEAGHVLKGAISRTPVATIGGRRIKGKIRGGIVPQHVPQGIDHAGAKGGKLITKKNGKFYHVGEPVLAGRQPNHNNISVPKGGKRKGGKKRGGAIYKHPYPNQDWLMRAGFHGDFVPQQLARADNKIKNMGISAGQFYWMGKALNIKLPPRIKSLKILKSSRIGSLVQPFLACKLKTGKARKAFILMQSKGLKASANVGAQRKLLGATQARIKFFYRAMHNEWVKDLKKYMPKNYPLLFK
jgi:hypothetical protein